MEIKSYRCKGCGAPLRIAANARLISCGYCGTDYERISFEEVDILEEVPGQDPRIEELQQKLSSMDEAMGMIAVIEKSGDLSRYNENVRKAVREAYGQRGLDVLDGYIEKIKGESGTPLAIIVAIAIIGIMFWIVAPILAIFISFGALMFIAGRIPEKKRYWMGIKRELDKIKDRVMSELQGLRPKDDSPPGSLYLTLESGLCPVCNSQTSQAVLPDGGYGTYCRTCNMAVRDILRKYYY